MSDDKDIQVELIGSKIVMTRDTHEGHGGDLEDTVTAQASVVIIEEGDYRLLLRGDGIELRNDNKTVWRGKLSDLSHALNVARMEQDLIEALRKRSEAGQ